MAKRKFKPQPKRNKRRQARSSSNGYTTDLSRRVYYLASPWPTPPIPYQIGFSDPPTPSDSWTFPNWCNADRTPGLTDAYLMWPQKFSIGPDAAKLNYMRGSFISMRFTVDTLIAGTIFCDDKLAKVSQAKVINFRVTATLSGEYSERKGKMYLALYTYGEHGSAKVAELAEMTPEDVQGLSHYRQFSAAQVKPLLLHTKIRQDEMLSKWQNVGSNTDEAIRVVILYDALTNMPAFDFNSKAMNIELEITALMAVRGKQKRPGINRDPIIESKQGKPDWEPEKLYTPQPFVTRYLYVDGDGRVMDNVMNVD